MVKGAYFKRVIAFSINFIKLLEQHRYLLRKKLKLLGNNFKSIGFQIRKWGRAIKFVFSS